MASNDNNDSDTLVKLSDTGETIKLGDEDIRKYSVKTRTATASGRSMTC